MTIFVMRELIESCFFSIRAVLCSVVLLASLYGQANHKPHKTTAGRMQPREIASMVEGDWIIESTPPQSTKPKSKEFLPTGLHVKLEVNGQIPRGVEDSLSENDLTALMTIIPPFPDGICSSGIGRWVCMNGIVAKPAESEIRGVLLSYVRWSADDGSFFRRRGAKAGARFVDVTYPFFPFSDSGESFQLEWHLWLKSRNQLIGSYVVGDANRPEYEIEQTWRRVPAPGQP